MNYYRNLKTNEVVLAERIELSNMSKLVVDIPNSVVVDNQLCINRYDLLGGRLSVGDFLVVEKFNYYGVGHDDFIANYTQIEITLSDDLLQWFIKGSMNFTLDENQSIKNVDEMCIQSLSPHAYEEWKNIVDLLKLARK